MENGFGVEAILDSLDLMSTADGTPDVVFETTADPLIVAPADGRALPSLSLTVWEINETNSNVVDFFTAEQRDIDLSMQVRCNPNGPAGISGNFLDVDGFVSARLMTEIPLSMRAAQIDFVDTVDVDIQIEEQAEVDSAELRLILHNGFPFEVVIRAVVPRCGWRADRQPVDGAFGPVHDALDRCGWVAGGAGSLRPRFLPRLGAGGSIEVRKTGHHGGVV